MRRPLLAVSGCNDRGNLVVFDNDDSAIISAKCPELAMIRKLVQQAKLKVNLKRRGGTYTMRTWRVPKGGLDAKALARRKNGPPSAFARRGS